MVKKAFFFLLIGAVFLSVCRYGMAQPAASSKNATEDPAGYDCQAHKNNFLRDYAWFFKDKNYDSWCEDCLYENGVPQVSHDAGPFCNLRTHDAGKICTDSEQCEGYCITDDLKAASGLCTEFEDLGDGCGWLELINGVVAELCVS